MTKIVKLEDILCNEEKRREFFREHGNIYSMDKAAEKLEMTYGQFNGQLRARQDKFPGKFLPCARGKGIPFYDEETVGAVRDTKLPRGRASMKEKIAQGE